MSSPFFWDVNHRILVVFTAIAGQPVGPIFKGQAVPLGLERWGPVDCLEKSVITN